MTRPSNNREWIERVVRHEAGLAVPYNFMFTPPVGRVVEQHYGTPLEDRLEFPIRMSGLRSVKPLYADPRQYGPSIRDDFGVVWSTSEIDRGSVIAPALKAPTLAGYRFPDCRAAWRFEGLAEWCVKARDHYRVVWVGDLWERATFMRGMEAMLEDVALEPGFAERLLRGLADHILGTMEILLDRFEFEAIAVSDDYGTQRSMIISPAHWRKLIRPRLAEIYGLARQRGRRVFHHSCGYIVPIIPDLIDIGLDILHPIQPEAMDIRALKREFGRHLTFCGGIRTQDLLVKARPDEVRREVRRLKEVMGEGGGYILEPGITLQVDVPVDNVIAMVDEARVG